MAPDRVEMRKAPEGLPDECTILSIAYSLPPREPVYETGIVWQQYRGVVELVPPETGCSHGRFRAALPGYIGNDTPGRHDCLSRKNAGHGVPLL